MHQDVSCMHSTLVCILASTPHNFCWQRKVGSRRPINKQTNKQLHSTRVRPRASNSTRVCKHVQYYEYAYYLVTRKLPPCTGHIIQSFRSGLQAINKNQNETSLRQHISLRAVATSLIVSSSLCSRGLSATTESICITEQPQQRHARVPVHSGT